MKQFGAISLRSGSLLQSSCAATAFCWSLCRVYEESHCHEPLNPRKQKKKEKNLPRNELALCTRRSIICCTGLAARWRRHPTRRTKRRKKSSGFFEEFFLVSVGHVRWSWRFPFSRRTITPLCYACKRMFPVQSARKRSRCESLPAHPTFSFFLLLFSLPSVIAQLPPTTCVSPSRSPGSDLDAPEAGGSSEASEPMRQGRERKRSRFIFFFFLCTPKMPQA